MQDPRRHRSQRERGYTILEVLIAMAVLVVVTQAFAVFLRSVSRQTQASAQKIQATEHALQMLEELRGVVQGDNTDIKALDNYADGRDVNAPYSPYYKYTLTTKRTITHPGGNTAADHLAAQEPLSGNPLTPRSGYLFVRHVDILPDANDRNLRKIHVRVWRAKPNAGATAASTALPTQVTAPLAEVFATVRSLASGNQPSQVLDVFLIAIENVPGWWSRTSNLIPLMRASLISLQSRNPGLVIRDHWIRRLSYGRDLEYTPEVNEATLSTVTGVFKKAYIYPGFVPYDDLNDYYYLPSWFKGRITKDGTLLTADADTDNYPMADQWNHAMRLPDEQRLWEIHKQVGANSSPVKKPEMSLRLLLEKLNNNDPEVRNSILINLHGEMVPVLPLRNYSDAAKDPAYYWDVHSPSRAWRAVSHPERLAYSKTTTTAATVPVTATVRVYAYDMLPTAVPLSVADEDDLVDVITVFVPGAKLSNLNAVHRMRGNSRYSYRWISHTASTWTQTAGQDHDNGSPAAATWVADEYTPPGRNSGLRIRLYGTTPTARPYGGVAN